MGGKRPLGHKYCWKTRFILHRTSKLASGDSLRLLATLAWPGLIRHGCESRAARAIDTILLASDATGQSLQDAALEDPRLMQLRIRVPGN